MKKIFKILALLSLALTLLAGDSEVGEVLDFTQLGIIPEMIDAGVPCYPDSAYKERVSGAVLVDVIIDEDGKVISAEVAEAQPEGVFDEVALEAALECTFKPMTFEGRAVKVSYRIPFVFGRDQYHLRRCSRAKKR